MRNSTRILEGFVALSSRSLGFGLSTRSFFKTTQKPVIKGNITISQVTEEPNEFPPESMDIDITMIGTGSKQASRDRQTSSIHMTFPHGTFLFDCGEACSTRIVKAGLKQTFTHIFITHLHGDHIFGLPAAIFLSRETEQRINIYGPPGLRKWVTDTCRLTSKWQPNIVIYELHTPNTAQEPHDITCDREGVWHLVVNRNYTVKSKKIVHSISTWGYVFKEVQQFKMNSAKLTEFNIPFGPERAALQRGEPVINLLGQMIYPHQVIANVLHTRKIVILGDTRDASSIVPLAQGADLLIHEATYSDAVSEHAQKAFHSTPSDAAILAKTIRARCLVLTHFSSRYSASEVKEFGEAAQQICKDSLVVIAKDLMKFSVKQIKDLALAFDMRKKKPEKNIASTIPVETTPPFNEI